jgi:hypothetical protein
VGYLDVYGRIILKWVLQVGFKVVDWIHVTQNRVQWWDLLSTVLNLWIPEKVGLFLTRSATISF